jgi:hypothetical protein
MFESGESFSDCSLFSMLLLFRCKAFAASISYTQVCRLVFCSPCKRWDQVFILVQ